MLVLARKVGQSIVISDNIEVLVIEVRGDQVRLGIEAPRTIPVHRKELLEQIKIENVKAAAEADVETVSQALSNLTPGD
ncbi:MAG: carbon storage regulator CsrA [Armatimonadetes bacterium]|nr:carbon storage regulator CsrA [Armatimonadota bacterium]